MAEKNNFDVERLLVGEGGNTMSLRAHGPNVLILFGAAADENYRQIGYVTLAPEEARQAAESLARSAYEAHYGVPPDAGKSTISETKRLALVRRVALMVGSFVRKNQASANPDQNGKMAQAIVDSVLSEAL